MLFVSIIIDASEHYYILYTIINCMDTWCHTSYICAFDNNFLTLISRWYELIPQSRTNDVTPVMRYVSSMFYLIIFYNQFTNNLIWLSPIIMNILCQYHHVFCECHFGNPIIFCIQNLNWQMVTHALNILHIRLIIILNNILFITYLCITQVKRCF